MPNAFRDVIRQLEKQKIAIDRAIAALRDVGDEPLESADSGSQARPAKKRRKMSTEARKRISEALRKRWAAAKKKTAKQAK